MSRLTLLSGTHAPARMAKNSAKHQKTYREKQKTVWRLMEERLQQLTDSNELLSQENRALSENNRALNEENQVFRTHLDQGGGEVLANRLRLLTEGSTLYRENKLLWCLLSPEQKLHWAAARHLDALTRPK